MQNQELARIYKKVYPYKNVGDLVPTEYGNILIQPSSEDPIVLHKDLDTSLFDHKGNLLATFTNTGLDFTFQEGVGIIYSRKNSKVGFIDREGNVIVPIEQENKMAKPFSEGLGLLLKGSTWVFINKEGKIAFPGEFMDAMPFSEGLAAVKLDENWVFINKEGEIAFPGEFIDTFGFSEGFAAVKTWCFGKKGSTTETGWGHINRTGKLLNFACYTSVSNFKGGKARVSTGKCTCYINKLGNVSEVIDGHLPDPIDPRFLRGFEPIGSEY